MQDITMINWTLWLSTMVPLTLSAGPGNLLVATSGARSGARRSLRFIAGLDTTYFLLAILIGFGLYHILMSSELLLGTLRIAGSAYILWLGYKLFSRPVETSAASAEDFSFRDGIVTQLGNVKGMVMLLVMFSTFIPSSGTSISVVLMLSAALISLNVLSHMIWVSIGSSIQVIFRAHPKVMKLQNGFFGSMLVGVAIWMFLRDGIE